MVFYQCELGNKKVKCKICGVTHEKSTHPHYKLVAELSDTGFPTHSKRYPKAHERASKAERQAYGKKQFEELGNVDRGMKKHQLAGKNLKSGKLEVSKQIPSKMRPEVAYHESVESKILRGKK